MNIGWLYVIVGGLAETIWATSMKLSDGFTVPLYALITVVFLGVSMWFLNMGFRKGLSTGPCYAVWVGIGAVGSVLVGVLFFGDVLSMAGWGCMALILAGVIGLNLVSEEA